MNLTTRARRLSSLTNWPYQKCLQKIRELGSEPSRLAKENAWTIDQADIFLINNLNGSQPEGAAKAEEIAVDDVMVPGYGSARIPVISEKGSFRPTRLVVTEDVGRRFLFSDIQVGRNSQFMSADAVHAFFFTDRFQDGDFSFDLLPRGMILTLAVTNLMPEPQAFSAVLRGMLIGANDRHTTDRSVMGLGETSVPPARKTRIALKSQLVFMPDLLVIPPYLLDGLHVTSVRVAGNEVMSGKMEDGKVGLSAAILQLGDWLCLDVVNENPEPRTVHGAIGGSMIR